MKYNHTSQRLALSAIATRSRVPVSVCAGVNERDRACPAPCTGLAPPQSWVSKSEYLIIDNALIFVAALFA